MCASGFRRAYRWIASASNGNVTTNERRIGKETTMATMPTQSEMTALVESILEDGKARTKRDIRREAAEIAGLSEEQTRLPLDDSVSPFHARVDWAVSTLRREGKLETVDARTVRYAA